MMNKAICTVSVAPLRAENSHQSEMISQLLYGETMQVLELEKKFTKIKMDFDGYEGWVDSNQIQIIEENSLNSQLNLVRQPFEVVETQTGKMLLSIGSEVDFSINDSNAKQSIAEIALQFLNVPYLWSGRSFFGIDCSGFTQLVYKVLGIAIPRDSHQQAEIGEVLSFVEESEPGDLAFFENEEGKIVHVGMMLDGQKIIHAFGKVRIDLLDSTGIFNQELNKHTHRLRFLKRIN